MLSWFKRKSPDELVYDERSILEKRVKSDSSSLFNVLDTIFSYTLSRSVDLGCCIKLNKYYHCPSHSTGNTEISVTVECDLVLRVLQYNRIRLDSIVDWSIDNEDLKDEILRTTLDFYLKCKEDMDRRKKETELRKEEKEREMLNSLRICLRDKGN